MISTTTLEAIERFKQAAGPYLLEIEGVRKEFPLRLMTCSFACGRVPSMR